MVKDNTLDGNRLDESDAVVLDKTIASCSRRFRDWYINRVVGVCVCDCECGSDSDDHSEGTPGEGDTMEVEDGV